MLETTGQIDKLPQRCRDDRQCVPGSQALQVRADATACRRAQRIEFGIDQAGKLFLRARTTNFFVR
jgi:hypothetical protein